MASSSLPVFHNASPRFACGVGQVGFALDRLAKRSDGLVVFSKFSKHNPKTVVSSFALGVERNRPAERSDRFRRLVLPHEHRRQVDVSVSEG